MTANLTENVNKALIRLSRENARLRIQNRNLIRQRDEFMQAMTEWAASEDGIEFFMPDEFNSTGWYYCPDERIRPDEAL